MPEISRSPLKTGQRPIVPGARSYKPGDLLFEEGSQGRELFLIKEGTVGVFKNTPDGLIELARIEKDGLIGEMSLLDNLPRSATVKAITDAKAMIINSATFQATMAEVPVWLSSIVKIVVSRLRDANKRVDLPVLRDKERGMVALMTLLLPSSKHTFANQIALDYDMVIAETYYVCRLRKKDILNQFERLEKRSIIAISEDDQKKKHICIPDIEVLALYEEFLILKSQKRTFREAEISDELVGILNNIAYVSQKAGKDTDEGTTLSKKALLADLGEKGGEKTERVLLDLKRKNLVNLMPIQDDLQIIFKRETISRIKKIKEWLPRFTTDIGGEV